ncbi:CLUMA_CG002098, isoform A [Clunio marinus]|uniref:CLUMA_CG002098, isoform A n=1 Tax=Clunio marinus TaxID=568069 RepID=A0A1J1HJV1_9DIPT|nr:CLUMA_CG002098, isoform A [Clunio marinus]
MSRCKQFRDKSGTRKFTDFCSENYFDLIAKTFLERSPFRNKRRKYQRKKSEILPVLSNNRNGKDIADNFVVSGLIE